MKINPRKYYDVQVSINLDERYAHKDGTHNVTILVYHKGEYYHHQTKLRLHSWEDITPDEQEPIYAKQEDVYNAVKELYRDGAFSIAGVKEFFNKPRTHSINEMMQEYIEKLLSEGKYSTAGHYSSALKKFQQIFKKTIYFSDITPAMFNKFKNELEKTCSINTVIIYLSDFKKIINDAINLKLMDANRFPFKLNRNDTLKCEIPTNGNKRDMWFLEEEEISLIVEYYKKTQNKYIGMFLFSYFANGINFADMFRLKYDKYYYDNKEREFMFIRRKTQRVSGMKVRIPILDIMRTYVSAPEKDSYVFDVIKEGMTPNQERIAITTTSHKVSYHLSKMCKELGITKEVTPTYARHSFNTIMRRAEVPQDYIDWAMGHCKGLQQNYFGGYKFEQLYAYNSKLLDSLGLTVAA